MRKILNILMLVFTFQSLCLADNKLQIEDVQFDFTSHTSNSCKAMKLVGIAIDSTYAPYIPRNIENMQITIYETDAKGKINLDMRKPYIQINMAIISFV